MRNILRIVAAERRFFILQEIAVVVMGQARIGRVDVDSLQYNCYNKNEIVTIM